MRVVVHRRSAGVHADTVAFLRREGFDLSAQRVVEAYFVHSSYNSVSLQWINVRLYPRLLDTRNEERRFLFLAE
jgi:hypothetical protein